MRSGDRPNYVKSHPLYYQHRVAADTAGGQAHEHRLLCLAKRVHAALDRQVHQGTEHMLHLANWVQSETDVVER